MIAPTTSVCFIVDFDQCYFSNRMAAPDAKIPPQWARPAPIVIAATKDPTNYYAYRWVTKPNVNGKTVTVQELADWRVVDPADGWILQKDGVFKPC